MRLFLYVSVYALAIAGLCVAVAPANAAGCNQLVGTADGWDKSDALSALHHWAFFDILPPLKLQGIASTLGLSAM